jgi:hypothetical protein
LDHQALGKGAVMAVKICLVFVAFLARKLSWVLLASPFLIRAIMGNLLFGQEALIPH